MIRLVLALLVVAAPLGAVLAYGDPHQLAQTAKSITHALTSASGNHDRQPLRTVEIQRRDNGDFRLRASINGASTAMVIDTGATSVVLTYETAKAAGFPLELLDFNVDLETAGGRTRAAKLTIDKLAIGKLVEHSVPALVVPKGQMKTNLLGMSFLDRLESWEVRADRLKLRGYP